MGLFSGIEKAQISESGTYLREGVYPELEVVEFKAGRTRKGEDFVVVKVNVVQSIGANANPAGGTADVMIMMKWDAALGHIKGFLAAAVPCALQDITADGVEEAIGPSQPLAGQKVSAEATNVETRAGGTFTKVRFYPYAEAVAAPTTPPPAPVAAPKPAGLFAGKR
jgi:hypothetical protein